MLNFLNHDCDPELIDALAQITAPKIIELKKSDLPAETFPGKKKQGKKDAKKKKRKKS